MGSIQHCESSIFETVAMWSMREWLRTLGLDHHNPGNNDPQVVEKKFRDYIRHCRPGAEELKSIKQLGASGRVNTTRATCGCGQGGQG